MERRCGFRADNADGQRDAGDGDSYGGDFLQREFLLSAGDHVQQHPDRRRVLHDDGDGHARSLNGNVIKIIRRGHAEHPEHQALDEIGRGQLDALPTAPPHQQSKQHQQRKRSPRLREDKRVDGVQGLSIQAQPAGEDGAAQRGGDSPQKRGGSDKEISAQGMVLFGNWGGSDFGYRVR